jgi:hypothetical protein
VTQVFISYRRDDTAGHAGRLAHDLIARFGRGSVFMDIDTIEPGVQFEQRIHEALTACDVVLVLIGGDWLAVRSRDGGRRLDDEEDFVRREVAAALGRPDVRVVPVVVDGVRMPAASELPPDIAALAGRQAFELSNSRWDYDVRRLGDLIDESESRGPVGRALRRLRMGWRVAVPVAAFVVAAVAAVAIATRGGDHVDSAAKVAACERAHGMKRPHGTRPARAGESNVERTQGDDVFEQLTYEDCSWPPQEGADPDGYGTIVVTKSGGPGESEASFADVADRIEASCPRLRLAYSYGSMGALARLSPFVARGGELWAYSGATTGDAFERRSTGGTDLGFYPAEGEIDVLRNFRTRLDSVGCAG